MIRLRLIFVFLLLLSGCAGKEGNDLRVSFGFISAYEVAKIEFHQGLLIEARERLTGIEKGDKDYAQAQSFLKATLEPARLKLLRYYARKGKAEEAKGEWAEAEQAYKMAVKLSMEPKALKKYQAQMNLKARQTRLNGIYEQRKLEDKVWLSWLKDYVPPQGLQGDDEVFSNAREGVRDEYDSRLTQAWKWAKRYEKHNNPEMAWLYADSYLRLSPGEKKAQDLKNAMTTAVPKGFIFPHEAQNEEEIKTSSPATPSLVTAKLVKDLINEGQLLKARQEALELRKTGNKDAVKLLSKIDARIVLLAQDSYEKGNLAFRSENIIDAVKLWQRAVDLMPEEQTYVDSLRRGKQIQESLRALKTEDKK